MASPRMMQTMLKQDHLKKLVRLADAADVSTKETGEAIRKALLEIEWLSRGKVSHETLERINRVARDALRHDLAERSPVRALSVASKRAEAG